MRASTTTATLPPRPLHRHRRVPYRGALSPGGWNYLTMLQLILPEGTVDVPAVLGLTKRGRIPALAARFTSPAP